MQKYVKYSNDYQARAIIDFEQGTVKVETIALKNTISLLQQAIVMTLLTSSDPDKTASVYLIKIEVWRFHK
ncbi:murein transglycosylase domain-containing protein [Pseudoalteromonas sp. 2CM36K]|uniref:murein transglycosylase domain-containing protein n=1 Tax=Pseudoalteromonas sp. 2CM36K TaxID=2929854 RepID=UPI0020BEA55A|nr:murein transglycosylase domain-containing protein [Pseudoalteromonas sp. 2CM36K]MCK8104803.1 murein transglycosylase domain-containing protein [Pseudoalteromonas sp. 2CM36K]